MGWIPSSATNVILNWPERIKTQPHDDRDNCFLPFDSNGPCGMTVNNDIDDDSATKHSDSHSFGCHVVIGVGRLVVRFHHAYVIQVFFLMLLSNLILSSSIQTVATSIACCTSRNGSFEVLSLHHPVGYSRPPSAVNDLSVAK